MGRARRVPQGDREWSFAPLGLSTYALPGQAEAFPRAQRTTSWMPQPYRSDPRLTQLRTAVESSEAEIISFMNDAFEELPPLLRDRSFVCLNRPRSDDHVTAAGSSRAVA
jgi:hypothetical protein